MDSFDPLVELGYEAVADFGHWPRFLQAMRRELEVDQLLIYGIDRRADSRGVTLLAYAEPNPHAEAQFSAHYVWISPLKPLLVGKPIGWSGPLDVPKEVYRTEYYNDWAAPQGFHKSMFGMATQGGELGHVALVALNGRRRKPFTARAIALHTRMVHQLRWAFQLWRRLQEAKIGHSAAWTAWEASPQAVAMLDSRGAVAYFNPAAARVLDASWGVSLRGNRLTVERSKDDLRLQSLVRDALQPGRGSTRPGGSFVLPGPDGVSTLTLAIHPLNVSREEMALGGPRLAVLVFLTPNAPLAPVSVEGLQSRFGLTPAEARLALALAKGTGLKEAAETLGIAHGTARNQLLEVFDKTGTRRQSALVRFLSTIHPQA